MLISREIPDVFVLMIQTVVQLYLSSESHYIGEYDHNTDQVQPALVHFYLLAVVTHTHTHTHTKRQKS